MSLVQKDSKNRVSIGSEVSATYFMKEIDERGRIILTPVVLIPKDEYEEKIISLADADRDRFIEALNSKPLRNEAFKKAKEEFKKKHK